MFFATTVLAMANCVKFNLGSMAKVNFSKSQHQKWLHFKWLTKFIGTFEIHRGHWRAWPFANRSTLSSDLHTYQMTAHHHKFRCKRHSPKCISLEIIKMSPKWHTFPCMRFSVTRCLWDRLKNIFGRSKNF